MEEYNASRFHATLILSDISVVVVITTMKTTEMTFYSQDGTWKAAKHQVENVKGRLRKYVRKVAISTNNNISYNNSRYTTHGLSATNVDSSVSVCQLVLFFGPERCTVRRLPCVLITLLQQHVT